MGDFDDMMFDEEKCVKFIRSTLPEDVNMKYSDDEILYVTDIIWDWYEKNGYLEVNADITDEEAVDVGKLTAYVKKELRNDKEIMMDPADVDLIVRGELQYEQSLEDF